jgi:hypothetical protein
VRRLLQRPPWSAPTDGPASTTIAGQLASRPYALYVVAVRHAGPAVSTAFGGMKRAVCGCNQTAPVTAVARTLRRHANADRNNSSAPCHMRNPQVLPPAGCARRLPARPTGRYLSESTRILPHHSGPLRLSGALPTRQWPVQSCANTHRQSDGLSGRYSSCRPRHRLRQPPPNRACRSKLPAAIDTPVHGRNTDG